MNECAEISEVCSVRSRATRRSPKSNFFTSLWAKFRAEIGSGRRKPANYDELDERQLEQRAQEEMAISKALGF